MGASVYLPGLAFISLILSRLSISTTTLFIRLLSRGRLLAALLWLLARPAWAQEVVPSFATPDTTRRAQVFSKRKLVLQIDSRYSIINRKFCTINGVKLGLEWPGRVRTGAAFYFLSSRIPTRIEPPADANDENPDATLRFYNIALYGEYIIIENPRWELGANLQGGLGSLRVQYYDEKKDLAHSPRDFIGLIEPSAAAQMRLFPWVSLGAGAGWRQTLFVPPLVRAEISGPIFYVRAKLLITPLVRALRRHEPIFTQEGLRVRGLDQRTRLKFLK